MGTIARRKVGLPAEFDVEVYEVYGVMNVLLADAVEAKGGAEGEVVGLVGAKVGEEYDAKVGEEEEEEAAGEEEDGDEVGGRLDRPCQKEEEEL